MSRSILKVGSRSRGKTRFHSCRVPNVSFHEHENEISVTKIFAINDALDEEWNERQNHLEAGKLPLFMEREKWRRLFQIQ